MGNGIKKLVQSLSSPNYAYRLQGLEELQKLGEAGLEQVARLLEDEDIPTRMAAAIALRHLKASQAAESLIVALKDSEAEVRREVVWALAEVGDEHALEPLIMTLQDMDTDVRVKAVYALSRIGEKLQHTKHHTHLANIIGTILNDEGQDVSIRRAAASALGSISDSQVTNWLMASLGDPEPAVQASVVTSLVKLGSQARDPLFRAMREENPLVRAAATRALGSLLDRDGAIEFLLDALNDEHPDVIKEAAIALGNSGNGDAVVDRLTTLLHHGNLDVQWSVARALGRIGDKRAVEPLIAAINELYMDRRAVEALADIGDPRAIGPFIDALRGEDYKLRRSAIRGLEAVGEAAVQSLIEALSDDNPIVRADAAEILGKIGDERAVEALRIRLDDNVSFVRDSIESALSDIRIAPGTKTD